MKIEKIKKQITYNDGIFNNKNEKILVKAIGLLIEKINELVESNNQLQDRISSINNRNKLLK